MFVPALGFVCVLPLFSLFRFCFRSLGSNAKSVGGPGEGLLFLCSVSSISVSVLSMVVLLSYGVGVLHPIALLLMLLPVHAWCLFIILRVFSSVGLACC